MTHWAPRREAMLRLYIECLALRWYRQFIWSLGEAVQKI